MNPRHQRQATRLLRHIGVPLQDIRSFSFMRRYTPVPDRHSQQNKFGPGLLTLHLKDGTDHVQTLHTRHHPSATIRYLLEQNIPLDNLHLPQPSGRTEGETTYRRPSLYLFWHAILCLLAFCLGFWQAGIRGGTGGLIISLPLFALAVYWMYVLLTRFCYLTLDGETMQVHSMGRTVTLPYAEMLKVNFDFAREQQFTHVMEVLGRDYRYRLFYIGRVPRSQLREVCQRLQRAGIDATCSLNTDKRHYDDVYHVQ